MSNPTNPWVTKNQGKAQEAFNQAARGDTGQQSNIMRGRGGDVPEPPKPRPAMALQMPGPGGDAVRQQEAERAAIARARQLQANKSQEISKQAERGRAGEQSAPKAAPPANKDRSAVARAEKLAKEFNNAAKYQGHER
jgi:hypothetical protein